MRGISLIVLLLFTKANFSQTNTLLYKIMGKDLAQPSYIWGTYHLLSKKFIDLEKPKVNVALSKCKGVIVETIVDEGASLKMMKYFLAGDSLLDVILTKDEYDTVKKVFKQCTNLELSLYNKMKPMLVSATLVKMQKTKASTDAEKYGNGTMDIDFVTYAKQNKLEVTALETLDEQAQLLYGSSILQQKKEMLNFISEIQKDSSDYDRLYFDYKNENINSLAKLFINQDNKTLNLNELLVKRNTNWMKQLPELMRKKPQFIAVGAGHLLGKDGLLEMLKKTGYRIISIVNN